MTLRTSKSASALLSLPQNDQKQHTRSRFMGTFFALIGLSLLSYLLLLNVKSVAIRGSDAVNLHNYNKKNNSPLIFWSSDFHISPIADIKYVLKEHNNVAVIDKSLSSHCHLTNTCARDIRVITHDNGISLEPCPNKVRAEFYDSYKTDPEMLSVDAFLCTHAASMCELFMPFQKPMVVIASTRYAVSYIRLVDCTSPTIGICNSC